MHNLLGILIFTLKNFIKLPILRYLGICNVLHVWHIQAIPVHVSSFYYGSKREFPTFQQDAVRFYNVHVHIGLNHRIPTLFAPYSVVF